MKQAVIETGGKQYLVAEGDVISVEKVADGLKAGDKVTFDQVLLTDDGAKTELGAPTLSTKVEGEVVDQARGKKVAVMKFRAKSNYFKHNGHRQWFTKVKITKV